MEGYLGKKGKRMGSRVKRYMRLDGEMLSNHHYPSAPPTWQVNVKDASISCDPKRKRILIDLYNNKLELYADSYDDCEQWYQALTNTKSITTKKSRRESQEEENGHNRNGEAWGDNSDANVTAVAGDIPTTAIDESRRRTNLGKNFKVVKPEMRRLSTGASSDNSDGTYVGEKQTVVHHQVYEETPASMIFKQFTFAGAK